MKDLMNTTTLSPGLATLGTDTGPGNEHKHQQKSNGMSCSSAIHLYEGLHEKMKRPSWYVYCCPDNVCVKRYALKVHVCWTRGVYGLARRI